MSVYPCLKEKDGTLSLAVRVQPGAKKTEIVGFLGAELKIRIASPPVDGAANTALIDFIASYLGIRSSRVEIVSGAHSRSKVLKIVGISCETAMNLISKGVSD